MEALPIRGFTRIKIINTFELHDLSCSQLRLQTCTKVVSPLSQTLMLDLYTAHPLHILHKSPLVCNNWSSCLHQWFRIRHQPSRNPNNCLRRTRFERYHHTSQYQPRSISDYLPAWYTGHYHNHKLWWRHHFFSCALLGKGVRSTIPLLCNNSPSSVHQWFRHQHHSSHCP